MTSFESWSGENCDLGLIAVMPHSPLGTQWVGKMLSSVGMADSTEGESISSTGFFASHSFATDMNEP